jgi:NAD(P)-dependent dehydrogenase (short-subunit alcohol dehydrogenase family)
MNDPLFDVAGRVIVVTGGLGQLGRQYTLALAERGARVAVLDLEATAAKMKEKTQALADGRDVMFVPADVTQRGSLETALARIVEKWETPFGLINNAAIDAPPNAPAAETGPFENYPVESWDKVMEVNATGAFLCCQVFGAAMATAGRGSIINISSIYGVVSPDQRIYEYRAPFFKPVAYSASKSALLNLTRYLATYWAPKNVRVNTLVLAGVFNNQDERFLAGYQARMPLGRMACETEYNGAIVFLLSDASRYMTGSTVTIDGGWTAW